MNSDYPVVDISHWQDQVDFNAMSRAGVVGVIHKATEGTGNVDDRFAERKQQADEFGLLFGAYHFLRPGNMAAQAQHFADVVGDTDLLCADHEDEGVSLADLKTWLREVERLTGKKPIIYSGHVIKDQVHGHDEDLAAHRLWLAHYTTGTPSWPKDTWPTWWLWQYTDQGHVPGIAGNADCNRYQGSEEQLMGEWTGEELIPPVPVPEPPTVDVTITIEAHGANVNVVVKKG